MLANLATSLFKHGRITTTETKAKRLRPFAEQLITRAKRGDLASFRRLLRVIHELDVAYQLRDEIAPRYANRNGGYTRIIKAGIRKGDAAPMAIIELVEELEERETPAKAAKAAARKASKTDSVAALAGESDEEPEAAETSGTKATKATKASKKSEPEAADDAGAKADDAGEDSSETEKA